MLAAGIPLVQAFEIVGNGHEKPAMQKLILDIKADVEGGTSLHEALAKHPLYFDDLFVNLVEAGEQAGALESAAGQDRDLQGKDRGDEEEGQEGAVLPRGGAGRRRHRDGHPADLRDPAVREPVQGLRRRSCPPSRRWSSTCRASCSTTAYSLRWWPRASSGRSSTSRSARERCGNSSTGVSLKIPGHRPDPQQVGHRALRAHALDHVRRRRAAGGSAGIGGRRHRQHRLRERRAEDARRGRHRAAPAARHGATPASSRTWSSR